MTVLVRRVIEEMQNLQLPDNVTIIDAGLGGPHFIFTLLDPEVTKKLIIIDIADYGAEPGSITDFRVEDLPPGAYRDAPIHGILQNRSSGSRTRSRLRSSESSRARVTAPEFELGLSEELQKAIPKANRVILEIIGVDYGTIIKRLQEDRQRGTAESSGSVKTS